MLAVFVDAIAAHDPRVKQLWFDVTTVARNARDDTAKLLGGLYGSDGAPGETSPPERPGPSSSKLPLTEAEFRTIANNVAPYMR